MTSPAVRDAEAACLASLERALSAGAEADLAGFTTEAIEGALHVITKRHGAAAVPLIRAMADRAPVKAVRRAAKRALYRLAQAGVATDTAPASPAEPVVKRLAERPVRAWLSAIDGTGSRAIWILFEGGLGGQLQLCSLILNDQVGILESAGGAITRKRLDTELRLLREHQKLPWVEADAARACALVGEAILLHEGQGTEPPPEFTRWRRFFAPAVADGHGDEPIATGADLDPALLDRSVELLELPEFGGWFVDPSQIHEETLALLQLRESRLVVSDQIKAEREATIVDSVIDKQFEAEARRRWARRLIEMALVFRSTGYEERARQAEATGRALADEARAPRHLPFVRTLAMRGLTMGAEVALGRAKLADVTRTPARKTRA
jgi:hypothetical protein